MNFYLSKNGVQVGPWTADEILTKIEAQHLSWTDYLFDQTSSEWILLMDHQLFSTAFRSFLGADSRLRAAQVPVFQNGSESSVKQSKTNENEWFVLKDSNKHGPFKFLDLVKMLQDKTLFEYDFVWNSRLPKWSPVAEVSEFDPEKIRDLRESSEKEIQDVFFRRRFARVSYGASLLVHNSKKVWKGHGMELSSGGAGIIVENSDFQPGQNLFLHFKAGDGVPPFNAICTIVSKQYVSNEDGNGDKSLRYGVKFVNISQTVQKAIHLYTGNTGKAA